MAITITDSYDHTMQLEELVSVLAQNFKQCMERLLSAEHRKREEEHDAAYNEFGEERAYSDPYPLSLAEAEEAYRKACESVRGFLDRVSEMVTFPSFEVAAHLAERFEAQDPSRRYTIRTEEREGLTYLLVSDNAGDEVVVDIDISLGAESRRNAFFDEKEIGGTIYPLYSFLPQAFREEFAFYKTKLRGLPHAGE